MESDARAVPPEQELTEALLGLSWPLPRTVEDADAALTRLEQVKAVLTRLEQAGVGTEAWWVGQVDALATQSGFVLEWWRPVLRDPDLDWTLNHQAHLTADLATLASAGARLLDQLEPDPEAGHPGAAAQHARAGLRAGAERRWGPTAVPPLDRRQSPSSPPVRPQPPAAVFGEAGGVSAGTTPSTADATAAAGGPAAAAVSASAEADQARQAGDGKSGDRKPRGRLSGRKRKQPRHQAQHQAHHQAGDLPDFHDLPDSNDPHSRPPRQPPYQRPSSPAEVRREPASDGLATQSSAAPRSVVPRPPVSTGLPQTRPANAAPSQAEDVPQGAVPQSGQRGQSSAVPRDLVPQGFVPQHLVPQVPAPVQLGQPPVSTEHPPAVPQHLVPHVPRQQPTHVTQPPYVEPRYDEPRHGDARHEAPPPEGPQTAPRTPLPVDPFDQPRRPPRPRVPEPAAAGAGTEPVLLPEPANDAAAASQMPESVLAEPSAPEFAPVIKEASAAPELLPATEPERETHDRPRTEAEPESGPSFAGGASADAAVPTDAVPEDSLPFPEFPPYPGDATASKPASEPGSESAPERPDVLPPSVFPSASVSLPGFPAAPDPAAAPEPSTSSDAYLDEQPAAAQPETPVPPAFARPPAPTTGPVSPAYPADPSAAGRPGARHRRPVYDFDSGSHRIAPAPPSAVFPQTGIPPRPAPGGSAAPPRRLASGPAAARRLSQGPYPPQPVDRQTGREHDHEYVPVPGAGYPPASAPAPRYVAVFEDDDDVSADRLVPFGLQRHQRRLVLQTVAVLAAVGALCWLGVATLGGQGNHRGTAPGPETSPASGASPHATVSPAAGGAASASSQASVTLAASTAAAPPVDAAAVESVRVTLLGGSSSVPQIAVLINVTADGTGQITVTGSYYGASGSGHRTPETRSWTLSGHTSYSFSVPIANGAYCGTVFTFTAASGGHTATGTTSPGC